MRSINAEKIVIMLRGLKRILFDDELILFIIQRDIGDLIIRLFRNV